MADDQNEGEKKKEGSCNPTEYGYNLFPERKDKFTPPITSILTGRYGLETTEKSKCERLVYNAYKKSKLVQLMAGALKASGCEMDLGRHVICEVCDSNVSGGYDPETNQIVVCQNNSKSDGIVQGILTHEMIHMYDWCNNKIDFKNLNHLACTEIRAANLTHCSFISALLQGDINLFNLKAKHKECVKTKAAISIVAVRNVSAEEAMAAVDRVFDKCYADLEPIGRRVKVNSTDRNRAYAEGFLYGYV